MKRKLLFVFFIASLSANAQTAILTCNAGGVYNSNFLINNILQDEGTCNNLNKKINIAVLDSCSFIPWTTDSCIYGYFNQLNYNDCVGNSTCIGHPQPYNYFQFECMNAVHMNALIIMLNSIPVGHHILAFTWAPYPPGCNYPAGLRNAFLNLGSNMFLTLADTLPFIFYTKKGFPGTLQEIAGTDAADTVSLTVTIECLPASVSENEILESLNIFPNPATEEIRIENAELKIEKVELYTAIGEKVFSKQRTTHDKPQTVDVSQLLPGVYFVAVTDDKGNKITRRFIKM